MRKIKVYIICILIGLVVLTSCAKVEYRTISVDDYVSKMKAGWIGQMAGVGWGAPTEFKWNGRIIPEDKLPEWNPEMINQFQQDDIYVEMTFLRTLEQYGFDVSIRQAGIDFANSQYMLWHANLAGRDNLRAGIAPPWSGHPKYNAHADDIDYQIEADYAGLISPGLLQSAVDLGEKFGRLMNYGDGLYGGQFVAGMYAEAFFETDIEKIIQAGLSCIPEGSQYHEAVTDVLNWYHEHPDNWLEAWQLIEDKYQDNPEYRKFTCTGAETDFNIDAKINGAYIVMGLLYGEGDMDKTILISMQCGQDSDCNPSNAGGILATSMGYDNVPDKFKSALNMVHRFSYTEYNFPGLIDVCEKLAREAVVRYGGKVVTVDDTEVFKVPLKPVKMGELEQCWEPRDYTDDPKFTEAEMENILVRNRDPDDFIKDWQISKSFSQKGKSALELFDVVFPPEKNIGKWQTIKLGENNLSLTNVQLHHLLGGEHVVAYARTRFYSDKNQAAHLIMGSDDGVKVWLNQKLIHAKNVHRGCNPLDDAVALQLKKGWNELLFKVTQGTGGWELTACLVDEKSKALDDLNFEL